jgi:hypothetical protein
MISIIIQRNKFRLNFQAYTPSAQTHLSYFLDHLPCDLVQTDLQETHSSLTLITTDSTFAPLEIDEHTVWKSLIRAWAGMEPTWKGASILQVRGGSAEIFSNDYAYLINHGLTSIEVFPLLVHYTSYLENRWLLQSDNFLLHSSAVILQNRGFLFLGKSGAGKSTIAQHGEEVLGTVLHDDKVLVTKEDLHFYLGGVPISGQNGHTEFKIPLTCIFTIKQDERDFLVPLTDSQKAKALVDGYLEVSKTLISSPKIIEHGIQVLTTLAHDIPGYELHFRKGPDFWKLIDAEFPV